MIVARDEGRLRRERRDGGFPAMQAARAEVEVGANVVILDGGAVGRMVTRRGGGPRLGPRQPVLHHVERRGEHAAQHERSDEQAAEPRDMSEKVLHLPSSTGETERGFRPCLSAHLASARVPG